jgi:hypothetical protein
MEVPFPTEYRAWALVKSSLVGPQSKLFPIRGGFHHFYANDKALAGYRTGRFPDGSVLVDEGLYTREKDGIILEGPKRTVEVMMKNHRRYKDTGGWGFEGFEADNQLNGVLTAEEKTGCFTCHQKAARDSVFGELRK